ncbi:hypothetical protein KC19_10G039800 [Ceratodon purpureus]|uniref:Uncharacterized protein n=1 Tax=Ceratodon purpureus TaxID=3225 RepID=A0A8T0GLH2_CERPU|nr:hypothetical protein KC19_10G039800 [Ceratodon purpureus]
MNTNCLAAGRAITLYVSMTITVQNSGSSHSQCKYQLQRYSSRVTHENKGALLCKRNIARVGDENHDEKRVGNEHDIRATCLARDWNPRQIPQMRL